MARLILIFVLISAFAGALWVFSIAVRQAHVTISNIQEDTMPSAFRNIAFVLLLMVMFGVASGWLGSL